MNPSETFLSVVIPVYNEEQRLTNPLAFLFTYLERRYVRKMPEKETRFASG
jgi:hypothetical protein